MTREQMAKEREQEIKTKTCAMEQLSKVKSMNPEKASEIDAAIGKLTNEILKLCLMNDN